MKRNLLAEFDEFMYHNGLSNVSKVQKTEMRRAFMGGCHLMLEKMKALGDMDSEKEALDTISNYSNQLLSFLEKVGTDY